MNALYRRILEWEQAHPENVEWGRKKGVDYWLFSKSTEAVMCRCRNEVPIGIVSDLTEEQAAAVCAKIRAELAQGCMHEIWVYVLVYLCDVSAIDALKACAKQLKERGKKPDADFSSWIRLINDAIRYLKRVR